MGEYFQFDLNYFSVYSILFVEYFHFNYLQNLKHHYESLTFVTIIYMA